MGSASVKGEGSANCIYLLKQCGVVVGLALIIYLIFSNADMGYDFHWAVIYEKNQTYKEIFGLWLLRGLLLTIKISVISGLFALGLGTIFGIGRLSAFKPFNWLATCYVELFRNTPLLVQMFFWYFAFPLMLPDPWVSFLNTHNFEFAASVIGLSIYTGAYIAEIVRAGIQSVPKGHTEAAVASGLSTVQTLRHVILPQAFRVIIPPLGSEFLNNMKNSSLAMTIGVAELCWQFQQIESFTFKGFEATTAASAIYLALSLSISLVMNSVGRHLKIGPAKKLNLFDIFLSKMVVPVLFLIRILPGAMQYFTQKLRTQTDEEKELSATVSPLQLFLNRVFVFLTMTFKGILLAVIISILVLSVKGLINFNWGVIKDNFLPLLIWIYPAGAETGEFFNGLGGLSISFLMAVISISVSFFIGLAVGIARLSKNPYINTPAVLYIEIIRGNPLILVIFWVYFFSPIITGMDINVFWSATLAFIIFSGAYIAEIVRAGIQAIPPGQTEAAKASGLSGYQTMRHIVLPQALKLMIPAIVGQFITIFKDTSLAYIIGVFELTTVSQTISSRLMIYPFEFYITIGFLYFACCYSMSLVARKLERKYAD
ncbi:MAG: amino acid ABC transporter permease [Desulfobacterium sp.]|nr:amino acid ABC transporter permease [Desulfobacterium sp.]